MKVQFVRSTARSEVPPAKARELIKRCNAAQDEFADKRRRRSVRHEFDDVVQAELTPADSSAKPMIVIPCNLSTHGAAVLCRVFLNTRTRVSLSLPTVDGKPLTVRGETTHVRYLSDQLHIVGMKFDEPVDPELFLGEIDEDAKALDETGGTADVYTDLLTAIDRLKAEVNRRAEPSVVNAGIAQLTEITQRLEAPATPEAKEAE